jgi:hypothetical protein
MPFGLTNSDHPNGKRGGGGGTTGGTTIFGAGADAAIFPISLRSLIIIISWGFVLVMYS